MRFTAFLPALALLSSVLGLAPQPMSANPRHLASRALLNVNGCVTLAVGRNAGVNVAGVGQINLVLQEALCLCTTVGAVGPVATAESLTNIENSLSRNTGITLTTNPTGITPVTVPITVGGLAALGVDLTSVLVDALILALPAQNVPAGSSNVCPNYPTGGSFEPVAPTTAQCASCFFRCIAPTPFLCPDGNGGRVCQATQCSGPSAGAIVQRRWLANQANVDLLCPTGLTACAIPGRSVKAGLKVDCLDTRSDVETCGGCEFPLHGQPKGVDCSVIDNAGSVSCVNGQCIVHSCRPGFVLVGSDCVRALKIE